MKWKFIPEVVKEGFYEGHILVDFPGSDERNEILKTLNFEFDQEKGMKPNQNAIELKSKMEKEGLKRILEVDLKRIECGSEVKSKEELDGHPELHQTIGEVGKFVLGGIKLSKNL